MPLKGQYGDLAWVCGVRMGEQVENGVVSLW